MSIVLKKHNIWYKLENRHENSLNQIPGPEFIHLCEAIKQKSGLPEPADSLTLQIKREVDTEYISLNDVYFRENCGKSFKRLVNDFGIKPTNPIKVTRQGMSIFPFCLLLIFPVL
jgi:hypothetical protein